MKPQRFWADEVIPTILNRDVEQVKAEQEALIRARPGDARPYSHLGVLLHFQGRTTEALHHFEKAVELDPVFAEPHVHMGRIYIVQGNLELARRHAHEAEKLGDRSLVEQLARYPNVQ